MQHGGCRFCALLSLKACVSQEVTNFSPSMSAGAPLHALQLQDQLLVHAGAVPCCITSMHASLTFTRVVVVWLSAHVRAWAFLVCCAGVLDVGTRFDCISFSAQRRVCDCSPRLSCSAFVSELFCHHLVQSAAGARAKRHALGQSIVADTTGILHACFGLLMQVHCECLGVSQVSG